MGADLVEMPGEMERRVDDLLANLRGELLGSMGREMISQNEVKLLMVEQESTKEKTQRITRRLKELQISLDAAGDAKREVEKELGRKKKEVDSISDAKREVEEELEKKKEEVDSLSKLIGLQKTKLEKLETANVQLEEEVEKVVDENGSTKLKLQGLVAELDSSKVRFGGLEKKFDALEVKFKGSQKAERDLKKTRVALEEEVVLSRELLQLADGTRKDIIGVHRFGAEVEVDLLEDVKGALTAGLNQVQKIVEAKRKIEETFLEVLDPYQDGILKHGGNAEKILSRAKKQGRSAAWVTGQVHLEVESNAKLSKELTTHAKEARTARKKRQRQRQADERRFTKARLGSNSGDLLMLEDGSYAGDRQLGEGGREEGQSNLSELVGLGANG